MVWPKKVAAAGEVGWGAGRLDSWGNRGDWVDSVSIK
jgi:hypothetical protein